jgi:hypothetical protein
MQRIMSKTTIHNSKANLEDHELTDDELDALSAGALGYIEARFPVASGGGGGGGGDTGPAVAAWNTLLKQYGAA